MLVYYEWKEEAVHKCIQKEGRVKRKWVWSECLWKCLFLPFVKDWDRAFHRCCEDLWKHKKISAARYMFFYEYFYLLSLIFCALVRILATNPKQISSMIYHPSAIEMYGWLPHVPFDYHPACPCYRAFSYAMEIMWQMDRFTRFRLGTSRPL